MRASFLALVILYAWAAASVVPALVADQNDWSGGPGSWGPANAWTNGFHACDGLDWSSPCSLMLFSTQPEEVQVTTTIDEPACINDGDLDADGDVDIIAAAYQGQALVWYANDGSGGGWQEHPIVSGLASAVVGHACDLDGDGDLDVAGAGEAASKIAWWENAGGGTGWNEHLVDAAAGSPFSVCSSDLDGDEDLDLCSAAYAAHDIVWYENLDGSGESWAKHTVDAEFLGAWWAVVEDIDGDGDVDIVGIGYAANQVAWWENDGAAGGWIKHIISSSFPNGYNVRAGDLDGDADADVVAVNGRGRLFWWENDGSGGGWVRHTVANDLLNPFAVRIGDLDGDADLDLASNERDGDRVMWFENVDSAGDIWLRHDVDNACDGPNDVLIVDIDGDSIADVAASFSWEDRVAWYRATSNHVALGWLESTLLDIGTSDHAWGPISWSADGSAGTSLQIQVRASQDSLALGDWATVAASGEDLSQYLADGLRYFQYRVSMGTADPIASPVLQSISVSWGPASDIDGEQSWTARPCRVHGCPGVDGSARIRYRLSDPQAIELALFDPQGRLVRTLAAGPRAAGNHEIALRGLVPGVYFYRFQAGGSLDAGRFVILR